MSALSAQAQSCSSVDLRITPGGRALGDVRNQGSMGWCASFSTADLISYRQRQKISGLGVAIHWTNRTTDLSTRVKRLLYDTVPTLEPGGSSPRKVLNSLRGRSQCLETDLPSEDNGVLNLRRTLASIVSVKTSFDDTGVCSPSGVDTIRSMFPRLDTQNILSVLRASTVTDIHWNLLYRNCRGRPQRVESGSFALSKSWGDLDDQLSRGNLVAFSYNARVLKNAQETSTGQTHSSTIVGRRMRAGKCEYLVRNSWGRSCGYYDRSYPCEKGNIWVPKENLSRSASDFSYYP
jgi:hypothetical protein